MLTCGNEVVMDGKALLGFNGVGSLLLAMFLGAVCLAVSMLQAVHSAAERILMTIVIVKVGAAWSSARKMAAGVF